jgi:GalNAc-alpha-(1->4)-GalNAc-alpha-(1->3)-diNAcBac-PP-undecaprenol alpha-1,4-N-acetyl-D-galactosaminyltransferase
MSTAENHDIAIVINDLGNGGTQRVFITIANAWAEQGRRICLITQATAETDFHHIDSRITRIVCDSIGNSNTVFEGAWNNIKRVADIRNAISNANAPITIAAITPLAILSIIASIGLSTRLIVAERNDPSRQSFGLIWNFLRRITYWKAHLITANSYGALDSLNRMVKSRKLAYLPNPLQPQKYFVPEPDRQPIILNVGRMYVQKAQVILIRAFANIANSNPEWRLAFAGTGPMMDELKGISGDLGVADRIDWLGAVPDLSGYYAKSSIFALPSHYEGMPNALLEAMWWGLPCIVSDASSGPLEVIQNKENGLVFPVDNVEALTEALLSLVEDRESRLHLGEAANRKSQDFEIGNVLKTWEEVLGLPETSRLA